MPGDPSAEGWALLHALPTPALVLGLDEVVIEANRHAEVLHGAAPGSLVGRRYDELYRPRGRDEGGPRRRDAGQRSVWGTRPDGTFAAEIAMAPTRTPSGMVVVATVRDVSARGWSEGLIAAERPVLEAIALGEPAPEALGQMLRAIEGLVPDVAGAILFADADGTRLRAGVSSQLSPEVMAALDGLDVATGDSPCARAARTRRLAVVRDLAAERELSAAGARLLTDGFRACWSSPILASDGALLGTFTLFHHSPRAPGKADLTVIEHSTHLASIALERARVENVRLETERRYETLSQLTSDFAYAFSFLPDGGAKVEWVTDAFARITGYDVPEWERRGAWRGIVHPDDLLAFEQRGPRLLRGESVSSDVRIVTRSGDVRWLHVTSHPVWDDAREHVIGVIGAAHDFTARKEAEDAKTMFLATASHELKTPLTVIRGFAQMLGDERMREGLGPDAAKTIERRAIELARIVDRILLSSRLETGKTRLELGPVVVAPILRERVEAFAAATARAIDLDVGNVPAALGDHDAIVTVVDHLLENALKYTPDQGAIAVFAEATTDVVTIAVADHGIGMTPEQAARCFEKFWQAESTDVRRFGGTGIGLYIVRSLVEGMGGQVFVESAPGEGSTFIVSLRRADVRAPDGEDVDPGVGDPSMIREFMRQLGIPARRDQ